jgi:hypothetical protein
MASGKYNPWANPISRPRPRKVALHSFVLFFSGLGLVVLNGFWFCLSGFF